MKEKKTNLWWCDRLRICYIVSVFLSGALALGTDKIGFMLFELLLLLGYLCVEYAMNRCPHCDRYLDRNRGQFCQHCGQPIREEKPDT